MNSRKNNNGTVLNQRERVGQIQGLLQLPGQGGKIHNNRRNERNRAENKQDKGDNNEGDNQRIPENRDQRGKTRPNHQTQGHGRVIKFVYIVLYIGKTS